MTSLSEYRARLKVEQEQKRAQFGSDYSVFQHWAATLGSFSQLRLLPNGDTQAPRPWAARKLIPCKFPDPEDEKRNVYFNIPTLEMYEERTKCPALQQVKDIYSQAKKLEKAGRKNEADTLKANASAHWLDTNFYWNCFVLKSAFIEEGLPPEWAGPNVVRTIMLNKELQTKIEKDLGIGQTDVGSADAPPPIVTEWPQGDFTQEDLLSLSKDLPDQEFAEISARLNGYVYFLGAASNKPGTQWKDWTSSRFDTTHFHELTMEQIQTLVDKGIPDLSKRLPPRPTDDQYVVLAEIMQASLEHQPWDPAWETAGFKFFRKKSEQEATQTQPDQETSEANSTSLKSAMERRKLAAKAEPKGTPTESAPVEAEIVTATPVESKGGASTRELAASIAQKYANKR